MNDYDYGPSKPFRFWMVWCETTHTTKVRHNNYEDAKREAQRLASINPGKRFHVLESRGNAISTNVLWFNA